LRPLAPEVWAALLVVTGCAGAGGVRPEQDPVRDELRALRRENEALSARVENLSRRLDAMAASTPRPAEPARAAAEAPPTPPSPPPGASAAARAPAAETASQMIPPDLAVVRLAPPPEPARATARPAPPRPAPRAARAGPPVPTAVAIQEPDLARLDSLARPGRKPLAAEAEQELRDARALGGLLRAHALEDFVGRYPQHSAADNALVEAATAYGTAGREEAACTLVRRVVEEYPAGDAQSEALERAAACEGNRGASDAEQRLLSRLRADFPGTPAAQRAEARLTQLSGRGGEPAPIDAPARSGP
jgi:hypothetical protein